MLESCIVSETTAAFMSGVGLGLGLELTHCAVEGSARKLWADADRPLAFVWGEGNRREESEQEELAETEIVPPSEPRGVADCDDSESTDSLQDANEFANMEELMAELDEIAMSGAAQPPPSGPGPRLNGRRSLEELALMEGGPSRSLP